MDEIRIPASLAGDPFYAASRRTDQDHKEHDCFACWGGWIYLGELVEDQESGEEVEVYTAVRCRRCNDVGQMAH